MTGCGGGGGGSVQETVVTPPKDTAGPTISKLSAEVNANYTQATIKATVTDTSSGIKSVTVKITPPAGASTTIALVAGRADEYSASFSVPENISPEPVSYSVDLTAVDKSDNSAVRKTTFSVPAKTQEPADTTAPVISNSAAVYSASSKSVTVSASVSDAGSGVDLVTATVAPASGQSQNISLILDQSLGKYKGSCSIPDNLSVNDISYQVTLVATDKATNSSQQQLSFVVPGVVPPADTTGPAISGQSATYNPQAKSSAVSASVTDAGGVKTVTASIASSDYNAETALSYNSSTKRYEGTLTSVPQNTAAQDKVYTVRFLAADSAGNSSSAEASLTVPGVISIPADKTPPVLSEALAIYDSTAKSATLSTKAQDSGSGINSVNADVTLPNGSSKKFVLVYDAFTNKFSAVYNNIPENLAEAAVTYTVKFSALDKSANLAQLSRSFEVPGIGPDTTAPQISSATANYADGSLSLRVSATDNRTIKTVKAAITTSSTTLATVDLVYSASSGLYEASYMSLPENKTFEAIIYGVDFTVTDASANKAQKHVDFQVPGLIPPPPDTTAPTFVQIAAEYSAQTRSANLRAVVSDTDSGMKSVKAVINLPAGGTEEMELVYDLVSNTYSAVYLNIPKNWSFEPKVYVLDFIALDKAGNSASKQTSFSVNGIDAPPPPSQ